MPIGFNFPGKEKDEQVVLLLRRHLFILLKQNLLFLIYFSIPVAIYILAKFWFTFILNFPVYPVFVLVVSTYYSFFLLFLLIEWIDYYFDVWVVTDKRLIDVDQVGLFKRVVSETRLDRIQDATVEINGMFPTLFHYGNIHIQTAARTQRFVIRQVSEPTRVRSTVLNMYDKYVQHLGQRDHGGQQPGGATVPKATNQPTAAGTQPQSATTPTNTAQPQPSPPTSSPPPTNSPTNDPRSTNQPPQN